MTRIEEKEVTIINLSIKNLVNEIKDIAKRYTKKLFGWLHKKLTALENWILKKLDEYGQKAAEKLEIRLNGDES